MAQSVGVVIIHGMGSQKQDFAVPMVERLEKEIRKRGANPDRIAFQPIFWAPIVQEKEQKLLDTMTSENRLDWMQLRSFVVNDASC